MESFLDRVGRIVAVVASLVGIGGAIVGIYTTVERPRVRLLIRKDKNGIPPSLALQLAAKPQVLADYHDPQFGSVTVAITNFTDKAVAGATLEIGGLKTFAGVEVIDSELQGPELSGYASGLKQMALQSGEPCPNKPNWPDRPDKKLDVPIPTLTGYGGHITFAVYGLPAEKVDACLSGAPVDLRYLVLIQDSRMLHQYPIWLAGLSLLLFATASLLFMQSRKKDKLR